MAVTAWGQTYIQATMPAEAPVQVGSLWIDTSGTATLKVCTSISPHTFAAISGGAVALDDLTDVTITAAATGDYLRFNGTAWVDVAVATLVTDLTGQIKLDDAAAPDDNTDLNASTSAHGLVVKATAPTAGLLSAVGIGNGETAYSMKPLFDTTNPAALGTAAPGTALVTARRDHVHTLPKLDDLAAPDDNTDLNANATNHGLLPKLSNVSTEFLNGAGAFSTPADNTGLEQAFRGLHLRTSPDADVALTTVSILGLEQWVADDGTLVDDTLSNNTAAISSAGAGGLDTGSEVASTWYEIYRIRKSSDGTLNTLLHRAKDYFLDESQTTYTDNNALRRDANIVKLAQTFDTDEAGAIEFVDAHFQKGGTPTGQVWFSMYATSAGVPTGAALNVSDKLDVSRFGTTAHTVRFVFRTPLTVVAGTTYALVLEGNYTESTTNLLNWGSNSAGGYAAGIAYRYDGSAWETSTVTGFTGTDFWFKIYVTRNDAAVTMPSGYDQQCKVGYVYNDSGSDLIPFVAYDHTVHQLDIGGTVATVTATIPTLTDYSAYLPPVPIHSLMPLVRNNTANADMQFGIVPDGFSASGDGVVNIACPTANEVFDGPLLHTEFQAFYLSVESGSGLFRYPLTWRW